MFMIERPLLHKNKTYQNARDVNSYLMIYKIFHYNKYFVHNHMLYCFLMNIFLQYYGYIGPKYDFKKAGCNTKMI